MQIWQKSGMWKAQTISECGVRPVLGMAPSLVPMSDASEDCNDTVCIYVTDENWSFIAPPSDKPCWL